MNYCPVSTKAYTEEAFTGACPVVGSYGAKDPGNRGTGERPERILTAVGVEHDVKTYGDAGHSFMNDHEPADLPALLAVLTRLTGNPYHEPSARDARPASSTSSTATCRSDAILQRRRPAVADPTHWAAQ